jgi:hypothetical protein
MGCGEAKGDKMNARVDDGGALPQWSDYMQSLAGAGDLVQLLDAPADARARQEVFRLLFLSLGTGFMSAFADPDHPDFVAAVNTVFNASSTHPDFLYLQACVDAAGVYRISGVRGTALFVHGDIAAGGLGVMDELGPSVGQFDLDALNVKDDGSFDILLSAERPAGYTGNWVRLDPRARNIVLRQASYDWGQEVDGRFAIERLDRPLNPVRLSAAETARRLRRLADYPKRYSAMWLKHMAAMRSRGLINRFEVDDWAGRGGAAGQYYYQGLFELKPGEVLVLESALPERCLYWNMQLSDPLWNAVDWLNRQSSLNGRQTRLDSDGRLRAVIALEDPGVPNWLDPGGFDNVSIMIRWNRSSSGPTPTLKPVPAAELRRHLPADTPIVTPAQREEALRARRRGVQWRRRW